MQSLPGLATRFLGRECHHLSEVGSTNDYVKEHAAELGHMAVVTAGRQTLGKGRLGRSWDFSPGKSLAMSLLLRDTPTDILPLLPLVTAVGVAEGLEALTGLPFRIKWSNDILCEKKKVCGILCESRITSSGAFAVAGIGVNLNQTNGELADLGLVYATSLFLATNRLFSPEDTVIALCNSLEPAYLAFFDRGFAPLRDSYTARCVTLGREVRVLRDGVPVNAKALEIAPGGGLVCEIDGKTITVNAGEVSVRGLYDYVD